MSYEKGILRKNNVNFNKHFEHLSPYLIIGLNIITLGFYSIYWIISKNIEFEELDENSPRHIRGGFIIVVLPIIWILINSIIKSIFSIEILIFDYIFLGLIFFLILKYLYDFCTSFAIITETYNLFWFIPFVLLIIGIILLIFGFKLAIILIFISSFVIPAMQSEINLFIKRYNIKKDRKIFYH